MSKREPMCYRVFFSRAHPLQVDDTGLIPFPGEQFTAYTPSVKAARHALVDGLQQRAAACSRNIEQRTGREISCHVEWLTADQRTWLRLSLPETIRPSDFAAWNFIETTTDQDAALQSAVAGVIYRGRLQSVHSEARLQYEPCRAEQARRAKLTKAVSFDGTRVRSRRRP